jgi:hypothetical protein
LLLVSQRNLGLELLFKVTVNSLSKILNQLMPFVFHVSEILLHFCSLLLIFIHKLLNQTWRALRKLHAILLILLEDKSSVNFNPSQVTLA